MRESTEKMIQISTDHTDMSFEKTSRSGTRNVVIMLSIIILLVATIITDVIKYLLKPCLILIIMDS